VYGHRKRWIYKAELGTESGMWSHWKAGYCIREIARALKFDHGSMISGTKNSHIVTLVERHSRYTTLVKVKNKETGTIVAALTRQIRRLPTVLRRSLTWDRGHELSNHKAFTVATNV